MSTEAITLPPGLQAVYDALLGLQRNGKADATAPELREVIERMGLFVKAGKPVHRIEKGWVNGRLSELAERGLVVKVLGTGRINPLTGRWTDAWAIPAQQAQLFPAKRSKRTPVSLAGGPAAVAA